jgi:hypothetical protein
MSWGPPGRARLVGSLLSGVAVPADGDDQMSGLSDGVGVAVTPLELVGVLLVRDHSSSRCSYALLSRILRRSRTDGERFAANDAGAIGGHAYCLTRR